MARGFGSAVLEQVMSEFFEVPPKIEFAGTGVRYELSGSLETIAEANERAADPACEQSARNQSLE